MNFRPAPLLPALFCLCTAVDVLAQSIVGTWIPWNDNTKSDGTAVYLFLDNGHYFQIENASAEAGPEGFDGFERGSYTWNPDTGALSFTPLLDTNGDVGASSVAGLAGLRFAVAGDLGIATIPGSDSLAFSRISSSIPIVGGWFEGNAGTPDASAVVVFLPNGVYFLAQDDDNEPSGPDGMEHGTYTWNEATGQLTSRRTPAPYADTNGELGLSHTGDALLFTVNDDVLSVDTGDETIELARVGASPPQGAEYRINAGMDGAWFNPETSGQGFFVSVFPEIGQLFLSWFTYDVDRPPGSATAQLGEPGHRWLTAFGSYSGNLAELDIEITEGGIFDAAPPTPTQHPDGTIVLEFDGCHSGTVSYDIPSIGMQGVVPIQRLALDNMLLCESLAVP